MHTLLYIHWDADPSIFGFFSWYGLLFATSFAVGYWLMLKVFKTESISPFYLESLTLYMGISTVVGARLGHCYLYDPEYFLAHPLEVLMVWKGGLASHGAAVGIITGLLLWSRLVSKRSVWWILDRIVIMVALSGLFIRSGNLMNSEILGSTTTSSIGFVFPRADQSETFRAKWEGQDVRLTYAPQGINSKFFSVFRNTEDGKLTEVKSDVQQTNLADFPAFTMVDRNTGKEPRHYFSVARGRSTVDTIQSTDSTGRVQVLAAHEFDPGLATAGGEMENGKVRLRFQARGLRPEASLPLIFMQQVDGGNFELVGRGTFGTQNGTVSFDTLLTLPVGAKTVQYTVFEKDTEILLAARHAGMMYEAFAYTLIFILLWTLYNRYQGRIPRGLFFGVFLILVFGARIAIEFLKEDQEMFSHGLPLNMGQMLSIPFVLYGIFRIFRSRRIGYVEEPPFPPVPVPAKKKS